MSDAADASGRRESLIRARAALRHGQPARSLELLRATATPSDPADAQGHYARLAAEISGSLATLPALRVVFLGDSTLDHWVDCLRFWLLLEGFRLEQLRVAYGTWRQQLLAPGSDLYRFAPDVVWFFTLAHDLRLDSSLPRPGAAEQAIADLAGAVTTVAATIPALCMVNNLVPPAHRVYGNFEGSSPRSAAAAVLSFNLRLADGLPAGSVVFDIAHLASKFGLDRWEDARLWHHSKHPFALDAQGAVAFAAARLLAAARGRARKCLIVDLDNTLWGGVVGDDGVNNIRIGPDGGAVGEAYARFQAWLKALTERGIALAVCSKNDEQLARQPFQGKAGMVLRLDDFVAFRANWENKADNIRAIAAELNLGLDAFVFVDDNPAERALVRAELPLVAVPELPGDPSEFIAVLASGRWFETLAVTEEDRQRVRAYHDNAARAQFQSTATDLDSYLASLAMTANGGAVGPATLQRATQLVNKTNQFHLTNTRYSEAQMRSLADSAEAAVWQFSLADRFGDHGIIAVAVLRFDGRTATIDTWVMSCRVFSRQMEDFIFLILWRLAKQRGCVTLRGAYLPTPKNAVVANLYTTYGGLKVEAGERGGGTWVFDLAGPEPPGARHIQDVSGCVERPAADGQ